MTRARPDRARAESVSEAAGFAAEETPRLASKSSGEARADTLLRVAAGDREAVRECIDRHGALVWSLARRFHGNTSAAEDLVQDVFIELWKNASRFNPSIASETTFVAMIARRRLIDARRKRQTGVSQVPLPKGLAEPGQEMLSRLERADEARRAFEALAELTPDQQRVLTLSIRDGMTYEQIANAEGLPLGTVKTHARRGLIRLRERLQAARRDDR